MRVFRVRRTADLKWELPGDALKRVEGEMDQIGDASLFNNPKHQKLRETWCAGKFGVAYSLVAEPCLVAVNESSEWVDADFFLKVGTREYLFQVCEAMKPDRKRGDEYKGSRRFDFSEMAEIATRGGIEGPQWIDKQIEKKASKRYANSHLLNLLVYGNFNATQMRVSCVRAAIAKHGSTFASIWLLNDLFLLYLIINNDLQPVEHRIGGGAGVSDHLWAGMLERK